MCNEGLIDFDFNFEVVGRIAVIFRYASPRFFYMIVFDRNKVKAVIQDG